MEEEMEEMFNNLVERYKNEKHEFDEGSLKLLREVFKTGFLCGHNYGMNKRKIYGRTI